jgi:hypothetical protein
MGRTLILLGAAAAVASCNQAADNGASNVPSNVAAAKPKHGSYCFFKDEEAKDWSTSLDPSGNVKVTGKMHVKDARYKAQLGEPEVMGTNAELWPTIVVNDTGFASPDNWWDVSFTIPNSSGVTSVAIRCGSKTKAELTVKRGTSGAK